MATTLSVLIQNVLIGICSKKPLRIATHHKTIGPEKNNITNNGKDDNSYSS